jgi:hypothetical protein
MTIAAATGRAPTRVQQNSLWGQEKRKKSPTGLLTGLCCRLRSINCCFMFYVVFVYFNVSSFFSRRDRSWLKVKTHCFEQWTSYA